MTLLDLVDDRIVHVEVLYRDDIRSGKTRRQTDVPPCFHDLASTKLKFVTKIRD